MDPPASGWRRWRVGADAMVLAVLAFVPALATAPGVVAADTKQYLVLDPGRLLATARSLWDPGQFGGHVTHQQIGYLWPMGPFFWLGHALGLPAWVTQRLWLGVVFAAAGLGARCLARRLGLGSAAAFATAVVYQLSPYVLTYANRTSGLLLPWAGLPWLLVCTQQTLRHRGWRWPALAGLVVGTIGGINATAVVFVAVSPALWLLFAGRSGRCPRGQAIRAAVQLAVSATVLSLWWFVGLVVEGRYGADVLAYSETVGAVSTTASATEGLRGLGYWLFYGGGVDGPWNSAARPYLSNAVVLTVGFSLAAVGLLGLTITRWWPRRWLSVQALVGLVLASVAFPPSSPSLLGRAVLHGNARSTIVLALRSATRALPLVVLALAVGVGAVVHVVGSRVPRRAWAPAVGVAVLAVLNLPALFAGDLVDAALRRPQDVPSWWREVAAQLASGTGRVLEVPGQEFAAYRWGTTTDPLLPGLTDRPLLTRDLLPLGAPDTMDLLWALDDRFQSGTVEPGALAPVARLLGATDVVGRLDAAAQRYGTPTAARAAADLVAATGLGPVVVLGPSTVAAAEPPDIDRGAVGDDAGPTPAVMTRTVTDPVAATRVMPAADVTIVGNGEGVLAAAAAGLIDGREALRYAATLDRTDALPTGPVIVTDTNRRRARQWRGTQDTVGYTEDAGSSPYAADEADARLPLFPGTSIASQTIAVPSGVRAVASAYGEPNAYRPEDRAAYAVDGDPTTAWRVADRGEPVGARIRLELPAEAGISQLTLVQPQRPANRTITRVVIRTAHAHRRVDLDASSLSAAGQVVPLVDPAPSFVEVEVAATSTGVTPSFAGLDAVGFAEVSIGAVSPSIETVRLPTDLVDLLARSDERPSSLTYVLTRERTDPTNRWRTDPELRLVRRLRTPYAMDATPAITARLDRNAPDAVLASLLVPRDGPQVATSSRLAGRPDRWGYAALDGDAATAWWSAVDDAAPWWQVTMPTDTPFTTLRVRVAHDDRHSVPATVTFVLDGAAVGTVPVNADGVAVVELAGRRGRELRLALTDVREATGVERRYGETVRLPVAIDEVTIGGVAPVVAALTVSTGCRRDMLTVDDEPVAVALSGATAALLSGALFTVVPCSPTPVALAAGDHDVASSAGRVTGIDVDRVVLASGAARSAPVAAPVPALRVQRHSRTSATVTVGPSATPVWFVWGEGHNEGWQAREDGLTLAAGRPMVGGGNAWRLPPSSEARTLEIRWTPQRLVDLGVLASLVGVVLAVALAVWPRRGRPPARVAVAGPVAAAMGGAARRAAPSWPVAVALGVTAALTTHVLYGVVLLVVWAWWRRSDLVAVLVGGAGPVLALGAGAYVTLHQLVSHPAPGFGWPLVFAVVHRPALFAVLLVALHTAGGGVAEPAEEPIEGVGGG